MIRLLLLLEGVAGVGLLFAYWMSPGRAVSTALLIWLLACLVTLIWAGNE